MNFKRAGKVIFGVELNKAEEKALDLEIQRQLAEYNRKNAIALDAVVLWHLYQHNGFDRDQLRDFYFSLAPEINNLIDYYEMGQAESAWTCKQKLKDNGIDIEKWFNEFDANERR